jgi:hypothetical protein
MRSRMTFRIIVSLVECSFFPIDVELALADSIAYPIETHVKGFGALLFDAVDGDTGCSAIVGKHGCCWLRVAHFFQSSSHGACFFAVVEEGSELGFGCAREYLAHDLAEDIDGTVWSWHRIVGFGHELCPHSRKVVQMVATIFNPVLRSFVCLASKYGEGCCRYGILVFVISKKSLEITHPSTGRITLASTNATSIIESELQLLA